MSDVFTNPLVELIRNPLGNRCQLFAVTIERLAESCSPTYKRIENRPHSGHLVSLNSEFNVLLVLEVDGH